MIVKVQDIFYYSFFVSSDYFFTKAMIERAINLDNLSKNSFIIEKLVVTECFYPKIENWCGMQRGWRRVSPSRRLKAERFNG